MAGHQHEQFQGKLLAQNLLLRGLYTQWAMNSPDPVNAIRDGICGLMDTVRENAPPQNEIEHRVYDHMDAELTRFMLAVQERLEAMVSQAT